MHILEQKIKQITLLADSLLSQNCFIEITLDGGDMSAYKEDILNLPKNIPPYQLNEAIKTIDDLININKNYAGNDAPTYTNLFTAVETIRDNSKPLLEKIKALDKKIRPGESLTALEKFQQQLKTLIDKASTALTRERNNSAPHPTRSPLSIFLSIFAAPQATDTKNPHAAQRTPRDEGAHATSPSLSYSHRERS